MNNSDLKRILNKLTAATPFQDGGRLESERDITSSACKILEEFDILETAKRGAKQAIQENSHWSIDFREKQLKFHTFLNWLVLITDFLRRYCACMKEGFVEGPNRSMYVLIDPFSQYFKPMMESEPFFGTSDGRILADQLEKMFKRVIEFFFSKPDSLLNFCKNNPLLLPENEMQLLMDLSNEPNPELSNLLDSWKSEISDAPPVTPCAQPKVAIIEDYLVEQGLAIGVAGILGATALGLYLRGNRAAAVALIATATAAVGGTATGAESVMNAVDTDYNRSVRFGGQQDCRDSNQTGTVEHGD